MSHAVGFNRDAGNRASPSITRSISSALLFALTRKHKCRASLISGKVNVSRQELSLGTKFAIAFRFFCSRPAVLGNKEAVIAQAEQNQVVSINPFAAFPAKRSRLASYSCAAICGSISPRIRAIDFSGTLAGTKSVSRAILKLLCGLSGSTQRSSPKVMRVNSHCRSPALVASCRYTGFGVFPPDSAIRN